MFLSSSLMANEFSLIINVQKQPPRGVPRKGCSENMQQIYKRTPKPKCDFNEVAEQTPLKHLWATASNGRSNTFTKTICFCRFVVSLNDFSVSFIFASRIPLSEKRNFTVFQNNLLSEAN